MNPLPQFKSNLKARWIAVVDFADEQSLYSAWLCVVGGLFVVEALSVIVQVFSFKMTGKRVFRMAPIHHHFEQLGWSEPQIVVRFWIISFVLALIGL